MSHTPARPDAVQAWEDVPNKPKDLGGVRQETGSGGISTDLAREPSMASPRLVPVPDFPPPSVHLLQAFSSARLLPLLLFP